jgi:hypothetical protein
MNRIYSVEEIREKLLPVLDENNIKKAVLFGSYAKGEPHLNSDIDILVDSGLIGLDFVCLWETIREALDAEVDLIDITHITHNSRIYDEINETGVTLHEK